ncbi:DCL family protein [Methylocapsa sp. D3K7]|uniref:DCL family protein n=1 Tax=Methylocapsa sp. D3K7 TaxID=3041435 RepID=UPI00244ED506|nr:DCL family protein [Methylocapsa sp. D3K7]WGJ15323.1 DCL family protein [Methylocapsa sp. D3K7]
MVKTRKIALETVSFEKAGDATDFFRRMLNSYSIGDPVSEADTRHLKSLLVRHDEQDEKIGVGIHHFEVNAAPDAFGGKCFWIVRTDGSKIDFSYPHCLKHKPYD